MFLGTYHINLVKGSGNGEKHFNLFLAKDVKVGCKWVNLLTGTFCTAGEPEISHSVVDYLHADVEEI